MSSTLDLSVLESLAITASVSSDLSPGGTISGDASRNVQTVLNEFANAFVQGDFRLSEVSEKIVCILDLLNEKHHPALGLGDLVPWESPFPPALLRLAVEASYSVYHQTETALLGIPGATRIATGTGSFKDDSKDWALFSSKTCTVFAVKGSGGIELSGLDHVVNFACGMVPFGADRKEATPLSAHSGLATVAQRMLAILIDVLHTYRRQIKPILVLTGHSSGGGVASLLYELVMRNPELESLRKGYSHIHCLTFGSAAVMSESGYMPNTPEHMHVSFINNDDPVPRLDLQYAVWIARALAAVYNHEHSDIEADWDIIDPLPSQQLRPGGELVLCTKGLVANISHNFLSASPFLTLAKHSIRKYKERLEDLGLL